ncbi:MFS transporter [Amycolatopsis rubida]|uniref:MFS transporter n=1 Tax=Amycolatopsis rubida TaxID=112413 RepID=A0ABX0BR14_9PSEU|nr:MFS transporter [Amycolatopsis sp. M39]MYW93097.1 MFS transporter [Amycolatopsis rubida]NEC58084.1 MFS transporter [Amycolatopsis rubida]OAP20789.1 enterobactin exporter EntS [Amycolatopsis sp. M39]
MRRDSLFFHADFRRLWAGDTASQLGMFVGVTAIPLLAAVTLAATPFEMGLLTMAETLGFLVLGLPAGVWVDRMRKRPLMLAADLVRGVLLLSVPFAWWAGVLTMAQVLAVVLFAGFATVFFDVSYQAYLPALVGREKLLEGNAKLQGVQSSAQIAGPSLAGVLVQFIGAASTVLVTGLGYLTSALCLWRIRTVEILPERAEHDRLVPQMLEGLRFVAADRPLRAIVACTATSNFFGGVVQAVQVLFLTRTAGLKPAEVGGLLAVSGVGGIAAALCAGPIVRKIGQARSIWLVPVLFWPGEVLVLFTAPGWRIVLAGLGMAAFGFGVILYNIAQVSYRQAITPDRLLGRMNASVRFVVWGALPLGGLLGGGLGEWLGLAGALGIGAAGGVAGALWVICSPLRRMRDLPTGGEIAVPAP